MYVQFLNLWYEVTTQGRVLGSHSGPIEWDNVAHPLDLIDDCICVGQVGSVRHSGLAVLPDHLVYLSLHFP